VGVRYGCDFSNFLVTVAKMFEMICNFKRKQNEEKMSHKKKKTNESLSKGKFFEMLKQSSQPKMPVYMEEEEA
jgi:hypothetical protein